MVWLYMCACVCIIFHLRSPILMTLWTKVTWAHTYTHTHFTILHIKMMSKPFSMYTCTHVASKALPVLISWLHFGGARENIQMLGFAVVCHLVFGLDSLLDSDFMECVYMCADLVDYVCVCGGGGWGGTCILRICLSKFQALTETLWLSRLRYLHFHAALYNRLFIWRRNPVSRMLVYGYNNIIINV